jgi:predicted nucleotide-binding protein
LSSIKIDWPHSSYGNKKVFIVHGHDETPKLILSNFLYGKGLAPIILHELPNKGRTIIEKLKKTKC